VRPEDWVPIGPAQQLATDGPEVVGVHGIAVLVLRLGDDLMAMEDRCTHRGGPLREGGVVRDGVMRSGS
jgi:nitrite reductase/ring-hydroxylating ferredoxin subunit